MPQNHGKSTFGAIGITSPDVVHKMHAAMPDIPLKALEQIRLVITFAGDEFIQTKAEIGSSLFLSIPPPH